MKTKRRAVNTEESVCNKKIITRNMKNKITDDRHPTLPTSCHNHSTTKHSPNTRAKCSSAAKLDSDPYSFSKMDEESKLPVKKMKMSEKPGKDAAVNTCNFATMTDPELLGPCEPGTSIELQGIVWLETETGLLVINVTWRGRTYVGTLLDSTKYEFTPSFVSQDLPVKSEHRQSNRINRCKKVYMPNSATNCYSGLRSNSIRHCRRLSESFSYSNIGKKSSSRLTGNLNSCYVDSLSLSAEASGSGESDGEFTNYHKYASTNKTRSVTRSLAKQSKVAGVIESDQINDHLQCSQSECFKKFANCTALQYHLQRCHNVFEEIITEKTAEDLCGTIDSNGENGIKKEMMDIEHAPGSNLNGIIKIENDSFEFNSDSEVEKCDASLNCLTSNVKVELTVEVRDLIDSENSDNQFSDLSIDLPKLSEIVSDDVALSPRENVSTTNEGAVISTDQTPTPQTSTTLATATTETIITIGNSISPTTSSTIRIVAAPTVSIPCESTTTPVTGNNALSNSSLSPALIRPKPSTIPHTVSNNFPPRKTKQSKPTSQNSNPFQMPSSTSLCKKRPLIPLNVSVNHNSVSSSSSAGVTSPSILSRHIRTSPLANVTPILPATTVSNTVVSTISSSSSSTISGFSSVFTSTKRANVTLANTLPSAITSLLSLKPIQPKPKSSNSLSNHSSTTSSTLANQIPLTAVSGLISNQTSYQRQILPSPVTKLENCIYSDERLVQKIDSTKSASVKNKRRKPDKKLRLNLSESNGLNKFPLNPIQPKHNKDYQEYTTKNTDSSPFGDNFKMDEENSHSPGYSDLSETNDTPAPILEKEIELKSGDSDKLVICTEGLKVTSATQISSTSSDSYDENLDSTIYNKPPALMPAVLSADLLNGSTNDVDLPISATKPCRRKLSVHKKPQTPNEDQSKCSSDKDNATYHSELPSSLRHHNNSTSNRRSFQSSSCREQSTPPSPSLSPSSSSKSIRHTSSQSNLHNVGQNVKLKYPIQCSNLSAINDYVWMTKNNHDSKLSTANQTIDHSFSSKSSISGDCSKKKVPPNRSTQSNGKFSVQALTSTQEIVSRSFTSSSTVISVNPNTKVTNTLFKN